MGIEPTVDFVSPPTALKAASATRPLATPLQVKPYFIEGIEHCSIINRKYQAYLQQVCFRKTCRYTKK